MGNPVIEAFIKAQEVTDTTVNFGKEIYDDIIADKRPSPTKVKRLKARILKEQKYKCKWCPKK